MAWLQREIVRTDGASCIHNHRTADGGDQLSDITAPVMGEYGCLRIARELHPFQFQLLDNATQEIRSK